MKIKTITLLLVISALLFAPVISAQDTVSSPSVVVDEETLMNAVGSDAAWIVIIQQDMETDKELVLEGKYTDDGEVDRKLALYDQDSDHNVTERYTLTAPSITVKSPSARFQGGIFEGDVYVEAANFTLRDFKVDGNVYFENEEAKRTFTIQRGAEVTGTLE
jgi:uncharacterized protein YcfL